MPMITVRYVTATPRPELRSKIAELAARLGAEKLGKMPAVTAVLVEEADPQGWFIGGKHPTDEGLSASGVYRPAKLGRRSRVSFERRLTPMIRPSFHGI